MADSNGAAKTATIPASRIREAIEAMSDARIPLCRLGPNEFTLAQRLAISIGALKGTLSQLGDPELQIEAER
jgi:hypothetical protein